jgi:hypothetical protein
VLDAAVACKHLLSCCNKQEQTRDDDDAGVPSQPLHLAAGIATMGVSVRAGLLRFHRLLLAALEHVCTRRQVRDASKAPPQGVLLARGLMLALANSLLPPSRHLVALLQHQQVSPSPPLSLSLPPSSLTACAEYVKASMIYLNRPACSHQTFNNEAETVNPNKRKSYMKQQWEGAAKAKYVQQRAVWRLATLLRSLPPVGWGAGGSCTCTNGDATCPQHSPAHALAAQVAQLVREHDQDTRCQKQHPIPDPHNARVRKRACLGAAGERSKRGGRGGAGEEADDGEEEDEEGEEEEQQQQETVWAMKARRRKRQALRCAENGQRVARRLRCVCNMARETRRRMLSPRRMQQALAT